MKKRLLLASIIVFLTLLSFEGFSQAIGDYRSNATPMNWTTTASWQRWNGGAWAAPGAFGYPGELLTGIAGTVTIQNTHTVTLDVSPAQSIGNLVVGQGASGILVVGNSVTSRTITITGDVTVNAGATFRSAGNAAPAHVINIAGNITNANIFNMAFSTDVTTVVMTGASKTISGAGATYNFRNLTRSTSATNINVNSNIQITGVLDIAVNSLIVVGTSANITLGSTATIAATSGSLGANRYIQLDGLTGANSTLIKTNNNVAGQWVMTFPIGTATGGYTPVTIPTINTAPTTGSTLSIKPIYKASVTGVMRRSFRLVVAGNGNATTFTNAAFNYNNTTDISAGDTEATYTGVWRLISGSAWTNIATISPPTNQFTVAGGTVATASLATGTFEYTIGVSATTWFTYQSGNYNDPDVWTLDPSGTTLDNPFTIFPGDLDEINILNGFTVTFNINTQTLSSTTIEGGGTLDMSTTTGHNLGTITGTGVLRVNGTGLPTGDYTSFVSTAGGTVEYYNTTGNLPTSQTTYNKLKLTNSTGAGVTFTLVSNLTVNGTFDISTTGAGTATWQINDLSNTQRTITLFGDLTVASGGRITVGGTIDTDGNEASTTPHALTMYGNITNNGIIKFFATDTELDEANYGNTTAGAAVNIYSNELQGNGVTVTFSGTTDNTVTCNNKTDFYRFVLNKGTGQQAMLTVNSNNTANFRLFAPTIIGANTGVAPNEISGDALSIVNGTLQLTGSINIPNLTLDGAPGNEYYSIPQNGALWLNSANVTVIVANNVNTNGDQRLMLDGLLRVSSGTLNCGDSKGLGSGQAGVFLLEGGTVNTWQFRARAGGTGIFAYIQTGGTFNVAFGYGLSGGVDGGSDARFDLSSPSSSFQMSGGVLNIAKPTGVGGNGIFIASSAGNYSVTGGTINVYTGFRVAATESTFNINSTAPFYNLTVNRESGASIASLITNGLTVLNNLTLVDGATDPTFSCNNLNLTIGGNFDMQAGTTFTPGTSILTFNGTGAQTWTYPNTSTITSLANVVMNKASGTLTLAGTGILPPITGVLTLTSGTLADGGKTINVSGTLSNSATHSGSGSITLTHTAGTGAFTSTIGGTNGTFGNLIITSNVNAAVASTFTVSTSGDQSVTGTLQLNRSTANGTSTILNISSYSLTVLGNITSNVGLGINYYIQTSGFHNAGGLTRQSVAATPLVFPLGSGGLYTPNTITIPTATTFGTITVRPVNSEHPNVTVTNQSVKYYWRVTSANFVGLGSTVTHSNYIFSTAAQSGNTTQYQAARYDRSNNTWSRSTSAATTMATTILPNPFNTGTAWTGAIGDQLDGEYTCGFNTAFGTVTTYYSRQTGNWDVNATWSTISVGNATPATSNPTSCPTCPVIIGDGATNNHVITTVANSSCGTLTLSTGSTLDCSTFTGHNFGTTTGGAVTGRGTLRINAAVFPAGDFTNFIGASGGTVEWYGVTKTIPSSGPAPQNISLTNYYNLVLNPVVVNTITLPASNLTIYNNLTKGNAGTVLTNGTRTINITGDLTVSAGTFSFSNAAASVTTLTITGNTTIGTGAIFGVVAGGSVNTNTLTTTGNITNNGNMSFRSNSVVNITFTGSNNVSFTGTGTVAAAPLGTDLNFVTVNKGTSQTPTVTFDVGGTVTTISNNVAGGWLRLTNGTFNIANAITTTIISLNNNNAGDAYTIPSTAKLKVSAGTVNLLSAANNFADLILNGTLEVAGGTVNIAGGTSGNDIEYAAAGTPTITVSSGALNVNGSIRRATTTITGALVYNQTGGTVIVGGRSSNNTRGVFEIDYNSGSSFTLTGNSSLTIQRPTGGTGYADVFINPVTSSVSSTSTIAVGLNGAAQTLRVNIAPSVGNFTVVGGTNAQTVNLFSNPMILSGNLTIVSPSVLVTNSLDVTIAGNLDIQGTGFYTGGTNTTTFNGTGAQTAALSAGSTFNNLTISKTAGTTLLLSGTSPNLNNLNILSGILDVGALALNVSADITNNSTQQGAGSIVIFGAASTHNIYSTNGVFNNLTLGGSATSKIVNVTGSMTVNGVLNFSTTSRYLMIKSNQLTFGTAASISGSGATAFIRTNGVLGDLGVTKTFAVGASSFTYGIGTLFTYAPVVYSLNTTVQGTLNVVPINSKHLTAVGTEQILNYYWIVTRGGTLAATVTANHTYSYPSSLITGSGGSLTAGYLDISNPSGWITSGHGGSATTTQMTFTPAPSSNFPVAGNTYHYSAGTSASLPNPLVPVYSRLADVAGVAAPGTGGNWSSVNSWTTQSDGLGAPVASAPSGAAVVILSGARINTNLNGRRAFVTTNNGLLVIGSTVGHNLGILSGTGTMRVTLNTFPAGNYTNFVASTGGTIEYVAPMTMNNRTTYNNLSIYSASAGTVTMTASNLTINGNVTIPVGTTLDNSTNNASMSIAKNFVNNGTFNAGTGAATVTFNGTIAQTTTGAITFNNLTLNKTNNLTPGATTTVNGILTLTSGNIISNTFPAAPLFVLGSAATLSGGSATSFVSGQIQKTMNVGTTFTFPVGSNSASRYRPVGISSTSAADTWNVSYIPNNPTTDGFDNQLFNAANLAEVSEHEYWQVANGTGTTTAGMTLSFGPGSYGVSGDAGTMSSLRTARWNGSQWDTPPGGGTFSFTGNSLAGTVSVSVQSSFSPQTIATLDLASALPIELVYFKAHVAGDAVQLEWETASELNNDFFTVERSATGEIFSSVGQVNGNGTTNHGHTYSLKDFSPIYGTSYYRLKQTDFDGTSTYSRIVSVTYDGPVFAAINVYPNPTLGDQVTVELHGLKNIATIPVAIYDLFGREWKKQTLDVDQNTGTAIGLFKFDKELPKGVYLVKAGPSQVIVKKLLVYEK